MPRFPCAMMMTPVIQPHMTTLFINQLSPCYKNSVPIPKRTKSETNLITIDLLTNVTLTSPTEKILALFNHLERMT